MLTVLTPVLFFIALLVIAVVYFQDSEGGLGDTAGIGGAYGVKTVNKFLERVSAVLFALLIGGSLLVNRIDMNERHRSVLDLTPPPAAAPAAVVPKPLEVPVAGRTPNLTK